MMTLTPNGYRPRLIDPQIGRMLRTFGAINIEGPKWCGKTWTAENHSNNEIKIADSTGPISNKDLALMDMRNTLKGDTPRLIDEWQEIPTIWDSVRNEVDKSTEKGMFILTGSSVPKRNKYTHSGAGRIGTVRMRTMSLFESGDSDGRISLRDLFEKSIELTECQDMKLDRLTDLIIRGGWPGSIDLDEDNYGLVPQSYIEAAAEDACRLDGRVRNNRKMQMLIRSLSRNESTLAGNATIIRDMKSFDDENIAIETFYDYIDCLDRIHLIEDIPNFRPNVRSDIRVGKAPKRHLADVSLAVASLGLKHNTLMNDLRTLGFMFESLCEHDLGIYAEHNGWKLLHYRDGRGRKIDAVVETDDGRWGAFEIKLGSGQIDDAAENLLKMRDMFEKEGTPPAVMCVICGITPYAYRRPDGVYVVPITSLKP